MQLYLTTAHDCPYLSGRLARNLVVPPEAVNVGLYSALIARGFRRSGDYLYRPQCFGCTECRSLRVPVRAFAPGRSLRRLLQRNEHLSFKPVTPRCTPEYTCLYQRYLDSRHPDGGMNDPQPGDFEAFLISERCRTRFYEIRDARRLLGVAICDFLPDGLSAVYTFFDPDEREAGLGNWAILKQIQVARAEKLDWLYLGYWIAGSPKMAYKDRFKPHQKLIEGRWIGI